MQVMLFSFFVFFLDNSSFQHIECSAILKMFLALKIKRYIFFPHSGAVKTARIFANSFTATVK